MSELPVGVLLAAGHSRRFGSNKLLHPLEDNTPMLLVAAQKLLTVLPESITVINPELLPYTEQLEQLGMRVVVNEQARRGMGSSIACGVRASQEAPSWLIALADMPYIQTQTIKQLANRLASGAHMVAPLVGQQRGHPVGFARRYGEELMALEGDVGARRVIAGHPDRLELVTTSDRGVLMDVDQASDIGSYTEGGRLGRP